MMFLNLLLRGRHAVPGDSRDTQWVTPTRRFAPTSSLKGKVAPNGR
jgi:hypothetical protein